MKTINGITTMKSGIEILRSTDSCGEKQYIAVDPNGYIGRTQIGKDSDWKRILYKIREYLNNNN